MAESTHIQTEPQADVLDLVFQPEIKEFIVTMVDMMPKMTKIMKSASKVYDLASELLKDDTITRSLEEAIGEKAELIQEKIEEGRSLVEEARERAEMDHSNVGIIGLFRMMKDPTVQKNLRFMKALLATMSERQVDDHE